MRKIVTVAAFVLVLCLGWYGGLNMFERGFAQAYIVLVAFVFAGMIWVCPAWDKYEEPSK